MDGRRPPRPGDRRRPWRRARMAAPRSPANTPLQRFHRVAPGCRFRVHHYPVFHRTFVHPLSDVARHIHVVFMLNPRMDHDPRARISNLRNGSGSSGMEHASMGRPSGAPTCAHRRRCDLPGDACTLRCTTRAARSQGAPITHGGACRASVRCRHATWRGTRCPERAAAAAHAGQRASGGGASLPMAAGNGPGGRERRRRATVS